MCEYTAYDQFKEGIPACKAIVQDAKFAEFQKAKEAFNFMSFAPTEDDLQVNGYSVLYMVQEAMAAYEHADFEQFGEKMGEIMKLTQKEHAPKKAVQLAEAKPKAAYEDMAKLFQGFLEGAKVGHLSWMQFLECVYEADQDGMIFYASYSIYKEAWEEKSWVPFFGASVFLFLALQTLRTQVLPTCIPISDPALDWTSFDKMIALAKDPAGTFDFVERDIKVNGASVLEDVAKASEACAAKEFYDCGFAISSIFMDATTSKGDELFLF